MSGDEPKFGPTWPGTITGATVVMYGGSPPGEDPWRPDVAPFAPRPFAPDLFTLAPCAKCSRHVRVDAPCPWCLRDDVDSLLALDRPVPYAVARDPESPLSTSDADALIVKLDSVETANNTLRTALRRALTRLRAFEDAAGVPMPELGALEMALGEESP